MKVIQLMVCCSATILLTAGTVLAGDKEMVNSKEMVNGADKEMIESTAASGERNWAVELSSGILFSNIRTSDGNNSTLVPVELAAVLKIDDVSLDNFAGGVFRGYTEFLFRGDYYNEVWGQENRLAGISVGPRYNFVQPGWKIVPFVEGTVGVLFADSDSQADSQGLQRGLGQDFNFTFGAAVGFRYDISEDWYLRLSADYVHVSNAGLSEPDHQNRAIDAVGPKLGIGYRF